MVTAKDITTNGDVRLGLGGPADKIGGTVVHITGAWTGTIEFRGTVDGVNFVPVAASPVGGGAAVTTTAANGMWRITGDGLFDIAVAATAAMTGAAVIRALPFVSGS